MGEGMLINLFCSNISIAIKAKYFVAGIFWFDFLFHGVFLGRICGRLKAILR